jgi:pSer/pThr/pTyr-binding forkhead associated (FHA) protein
MGLEAGVLKIELKFKNKILTKLETEKPEITIGRSSSADIQIDNLAVSKRHARIIKHRNQYSVEDLDSTNGTFLNDEKIVKAVLKHNDVVAIGKHSLRISHEKNSKKPIPDFGDRTIKVKK